LLAEPLCDLFARRTEMSDDGSDEVFTMIDHRFWVARMIDEVAANRKALNDYYKLLDLDEDSFLEDDPVLVKRVHIRVGVDEPVYEYCYLLCFGYEQHWNKPHAAYFGYESLKCSYLMEGLEKEQHFEGLSSDTWYKWKSVLKGEPAVYDLGCWALADAAEIAEERYKELDVSDLPAMVKYVSSLEVFAVSWDEDNPIAHLYVEADDVVSGQFFEDYDELVPDNWDDIIEGKFRFGRGVIQGATQRGPSRPRGRVLVVDPVQQRLGPLTAPPRCRTTNI